MKTPRPTKVPRLIELVSDEAKIKTQVYLTSRPSLGHELIDNVLCGDRALRVLKSHPEGAGISLLRVHINKIKVNRGQCKVLHLSSKQHLHKSLMEPWLLGSG